MLTAAKLMHGSGKRGATTVGLVGRGMVSLSGQPLQPQWALYNNQPMQSRAMSTRYSHDNLPVNIVRWRFNFYIFIKCCFGSPRYGIGSFSFEI